MAAGSNRKEAPSEPFKRVLGLTVRAISGDAEVQVSYAITFQGVELPKLSPGSRGVVLLMLYLAVDQWDSRPLIVDQPEENLDPQSVFGSAGNFSTPWSSKSAAFGTLPPLDSALRPVWREWGL